MATDFEQKPLIFSHVPQELLRVHCCIRFWMREMHEAIQKKFKKKVCQIMYTRSVIFLTSALALGACSESFPNSLGSESIPPIPEQVVALAAPNQDLATARLRPEDNCYWYMHSGPVETTLLPLRTEGGNPICVKPAA